MFSIIFHEPLQYNGYVYPGWAEWIGWSLALSSILMIPLVAIFKLITTPGTLKQVNNNRVALEIHPKIKLNKHKRKVKYT